MAMPLENGTCGIKSLPNEILGMIADYLAVADASSLLQTCRAFANIFGQWRLIEQDVEENSCNSLAWACRFGDRQLAQSSLAAGASPNTIFCPNYGTTLFPLKEDGIEIITDETWEEAFFSVYEWPAFPYRFATKKQEVFKVIFGRRLTQSALSLATTYDHVEVMELLLQYGADTVQRSIDPDLLPIILESLRHVPLISQVRSSEAAALLIKYGAQECLRDIVAQGHTALDMVLLGNSPHLDPESTAVSNTELCKVVKLLLENGASSRRPALRGLRAYYKGPLLTAIYLRSPELVELIASHGPLVYRGEPNDIQDALFIGLGMLDSWCIIGNECPEFKVKLLEALFRAGVDPNGSFDDEWTPLSIAVQSGQVPVVDLLLRWNADIDLAPARGFCPLSRALMMNSGDNPMVTLLLERGANPDQVSLGGQGMPPLLIAACDSVCVAAFKALLQRGARPDVKFFQKMPSLRGAFAQSTTVLQCLLRGRPFEVEPGVEEQFIVAFPWTPSAATSCRSQIVEARRQKFEAFVESPPTRRLLQRSLYTRDNGHILSWACEHLSGFNLKEAVKLLTPHYRRTAKSFPLDLKHPLITLLCVTKRQDYLAFGTLDETYSVLKTLMSTDVRDPPRAVQTALHSVVQIFAKLIDLETWERMKKHHSDRMNNTLCWDVSESFLKLVNEDEEKPSCSRRNIDFKLISSRGYLVEEYIRQRGNNIGRMMELLMDAGAQLYVPDSSGTWLVAMAKVRGLLDYIPKQYRDLEQEAALGIYPDK